MNRKILYTTLTLVAILTLTNSVISQPNSPSDVREYMVDAYTKDGSTDLSYEVDPTSIQSNNVNKTASRTFIEVFAHTGTSTSTSLTALNINWGIDGAPSISQDCGAANTRVEIQAGVTAGAGGHGESRIICELNEYMDRPFWVNSTVIENSNTASPLQGFTVWNLDVMNTTATSSVTLASQTLTLEPLQALVPFILLAFFIVLAEWKKDSIYFLLSALLTIFVAINLPEPFPEYTRVFLVALILYLGLRTYIEFKQSRYEPSPDDAGIDEIDDL